MHSKIKTDCYFASLVLFQVCKQLGTKGQFQFQYEIMIYWHFFNTFMIMMINADTGCLSYKSISGLPLVITRRLIGGGLQISIFNMKWGKSSVQGTYSWIEWHHTINSIEEISGHMVQTVQQHLQWWSIKPLSVMISIFKITYFQPCSQKMHNLI